MTGRGAHEGRFEKARGWFLRASAATPRAMTVEKTGEALDVSAWDAEAALPVAFNLARLVEDRGWSRTRSGGTETCWWRRRR